MNHAIELRKTTDKTVKEICAITGISQAAFNRRLKEKEKIMYKNFNAFNYFATDLLPHSTLLCNGEENPNGFNNISKKSKKG